MKLLRILIYEGSEQWIKTILDRSYIKDNKQVGYNNNVKDVYRTSNDLIIDEILHDINSIKESVEEENNT